MPKPSIAIMTSGGDSPGMNPAIKEFVDYCFKKNVTPHLIYDGLEGLIDGTIKKATHEEVSGIMHLGGTKIRSSRSKRFYEPKFRKQAYKNLKSHSIEKIVLLGGDGSFRALGIFQKEFGIDFVGIPSTIDNDIYGTDYCLGVDTALNTIRNAIDSIRDTSASFKRAFVIETMGRECGYLALVSALTSGAEICIIPEMEYDLEKIGKRLKKELKEGRRYIIAIVAEGCKATDKIVKWLEEDIGIETRATILGHIQRGGNPTVFDRLMAAKFITNAIDRLLKKKGSSVIVHRDSKFEYLGIEEVNSNSYEIDKELLELAGEITN